MKVTRVLVVAVARRASGSKKRWLRDSRISFFCSISCLRSNERSLGGVFQVQINMSVDTWPPDGRYIGAGK
jgi:hypothetical protein